MRKRLVALSVIAVITTTCAGQALAQLQNPLSAIQQELSTAFPRSSALSLWERERKETQRETSRLITPDRARVQ